MCIPCVYFPFFYFKRIDFFYGYKSNFEACFDSLDFVYYRLINVMRVTIHSHLIKGVKGHNIIANKQLSFFLVIRMFNFIKTC